MTDSSIATPEEMLSALERWADAKGWWLGSDTDRWFVERPTWVVRTPSAGGRLSIALGGNGLEYAVTPEWAVAWALTVEAGLEAVDVGPCPACAKRSLPGRKLVTVEWAQRDWKGFWSDPQMCQWERSRFAVGPMVSLTVDGATRWSAGGHKVMEFASRPCHDCNGTGRDLRAPARLVLDAAPRPYPEDERRILFGDNPPPRVRLGGCGDEVSTTHRPGDIIAREHLSVIADRLITRGETLGYVLSLALSREDIGSNRDTRVGVEALAGAWESLTVPCERCLATGRVRKLWPEFGTRNHTEACPDCRGHGRVKPAAVEPPGHTRLLVAAPPDPSNAHQWYQSINEQIVAYAMPRYERGDDVQGLDVVVPTAVWFELRSTWRGVDHDISLLDAIVEYWRLEGISIVSDRGHRHGARAVAV